MGKTINKLKFKERGVKQSSKFAPYLPTTLYILTKDGIEYKYYDDEVKHNKIPQVKLSILLETIANDEIVDVVINGLQLGENNTLKCSPKWNFEKA